MYHMVCQQPGIDKKKADGNAEESSLQMNGVMTSQQATVWRSKGG
jgi:hypothetical protein